VTGSGGATGTGTGGTGAGGDGTGGAGGISGQGGSGAGGGAGTGGARADAGVPPRDASADLRVDTGGPDPVVLGPGDLAAGNVSGLPVGALNAIPGKTVAIGRDSLGLYALTLVCTHQGCTAAPAGATGARQINCPCHGSQYDSNGNVIRGPAPRPLVHFAVTVDAAGNIVVHTNTQVAATVRVMP
jgi:Rieske Fe-S protein